MRPSCSLTDIDRSSSVSSARAVPMASRRFFWVGGMVQENGPGAPGGRAVSDSAAALIIVDGRLGIRGAGRTVKLSNRITQADDAAQESWRTLATIHAAAVALRRFAGRRSGGGIALHG